MTDIHEQLRTLLDKEGAVYRVLEHESEGRTEVITQIRGNRIEQAIKSMVVQVRMSKKENLYYLANVPGDCRVDFDAIKAHFNAAGIGLLADPMIKENDEVVFNAGSLEKSIFMKLEDYFRIANPQIVSIALRG